MSGTINKVILIGHLGDEVKMNYFEGGNSVNASSSISVPQPDPSGGEVNPS